MIQEPIHLSEMIGFLGIYWDISDAFWWIFENSNFPALGMVHTDFNLNEAQG